MATRTINLYPSSDISAGHTASSGNSRYSMINDTTDDSGSTYIEHELSTSNTTKTSSFNCLPNSSDNPPTGKIKVKSIKIETYWNVYQSNASSVSGRLTAGVAFDDSSTFTNGTATTSTTSSNNYSLKTDTITGLSIIDSTFENINSLNAQLKLETYGRYVSNN